MARDLAPDWILKEALGVQDTSAQWFKDQLVSMQGGKAPAYQRQNEKDDSGLTLTVLGCGTMGIAILGGILDSLASDAKDDTPTPAKLPTRFHACLRSARGAKRVETELSKHKEKVQIHQGENLAAVQDADVVLLGCKPQMAVGILDSDDMRTALKGKLLLSILAGVPETQLEKSLYPGGASSEDACTIVRAMPNTAAAVRESMTVIGISNPPLPDDTNTLITWIFTRIGKVVHLPPANMDACTALCGSGPAFAAVFLESMAAGAIAMGVPRDEAYIMAAQTVRGTTGLMQQGEHPAVLRDKVSTPGGCTIGGLLVLEENSFRGTVSRAVREATVVASQLGQGKQGVNGTRH